LTSMVRFYKISLAGVGSVSPGTIEQGAPVRDHRTWAKDTDLIKEE